MQQTYVKFLLGSSLLAVLLIAAANYLIDPYGIHRFIDRDGFNRRKPKAGNHSDLVKPYDVQRVRPRTLLLGNSRVEAGIDPESPLWPEASRPVYNMGLRGRRMDQARKSLQHVLGTAKPELVVLGLEFIDFVANERVAAGAQAKMPETPEFDRRLLVKVDGSRNDFYPLQKAMDLASTLFSLNALLDSALTLALQHRSDQPDLTNRGFAPMREYERLARVEGYATLFRHVETSYLTTYLRRRKTLFADGSATSAELDQLQDLLKICRAHGIRLLLYIHPYHAHILESYRIAGLWPLFEEWKRGVVEMLEADARAHPGAPAFVLWDFSGYNEITTERVPAASDGGRVMKYYWEAGHYRREVGEVMLARMLGNGGEHGRTPEAAFGARLGVQNIDGHLAAIRDARRRYADTRVDEIAALETIAQSIRARTEDGTASR